MTRARARNIENKVNSFLFESHLDSRENWILPQSETLFILRYEEVDREKKMETRASMEQGRGEENEKEEEDLERLVLPLRPSKRYFRRTSALLPLNPTNSYVRATRVQYYCPARAALPLQRYYRPRV